MPAITSATLTGPWPVRNEVHWSRSAACSSVAGIGSLSRDAGLLWLGKPSGWRGMAADAGLTEAAGHAARLAHRLSGVLGELGRRADGLWHHAFTAQPLPPRWLVLASGALAFAVVVSARVWPVART